MGGYLVRAPLGGQAWHYLQYLVGLAALGHEVLYIEDSYFFADDEYEEDEWFFNPVAGTSGRDPAYGLDFTHNALVRFGLGDRWAVYQASTSQWHGPAATIAEAYCRDADLFVNISGVNPVRPWLATIPRRLFVDTDPCFTQIRLLSNPINRRHALQHNAFTTFGENIASGESHLPDDSIHWFPTRQPMVLDAWPVSPGRPDAPTTTVMAWQTYDPVKYGGRTYGVKADSFEPFVDLPLQRTETFELALSGTTAPRDRLRRNGWRLLDRGPKSLDDYQSYLAGSRAEFGIAKAGYVVSASGWFSERSAAYLASGRPVVVQSTGFEHWLPAGLGILSFTTPDDAITALDDLEARYAQHCTASREVVSAYFDHKIVLSRMIEQVFAADPTSSRVAR